MTSTSPGDLTRSFAVAAAILAVCFALVAVLFPEGVNRSFAARAWWPLLVLSGLGFLAAALLDRKADEADTETTTESGTEPRPGAERGRGPGVRDLALALLPLAPVLRYLLVNQQVLTLPAALVIVAGFAAASMLLVIVVPLAAARLARVSDRTVVQVALAASLFVLLNMASVAESQEWFQTGTVWLQVLILVGVTGVLMLLAQAPGPAFAGVVLLFVGVEVANGLLLQPEEPLDTARAAEGGGDDDELAPSETEPWDDRPDIYLLVYESYANQETMSAYGFDNTEHVEFLEAEGFTVYHGTYSVAGTSIRTMSRVLQASRSIRRDMFGITAGDSYTTRVLSSQGYETAGIFYFDYLYGSHQPAYDVNFPGRSLAWEPLVTSILRGEFRADKSYNVADYNEYLAAKRAALASGGKTPEFMYSHNRYPGHSQNSGRCLPGETEQYFENVATANEEMSGDLDAMDDREAIVIIAGDHGPHLTKNCTSLGEEYDAEEVTRLDVQDRLGTFLAIRWPASLNAHQRIEVVQDAFPAIFAQLSGDQTVWEERRVEPLTLNPSRSGGVTVDGGTIVGGADDGEPLFLGP